MQIKKGLEQFNKGKALLAVAGDRRAKIYSAENGQIELLEDFLIELPDYGDKEAFFGKMKGGIGAQISGSAMEINRPEAKAKFSRALAKKIRAAIVKNKIKVIYFFGPSYMRSILEDALPNSDKQLIKSYIVGNHLHAHPFDLIAKLKVLAKK